MGVAYEDLAGRLLKVESDLVSDLPEVVSSLSERGLRHWQERSLCQHLTTLGNSQSVSNDILDGVRQNPQLWTGLIGDSDVVITPCRPPPTRAAVCKWLKGKELYAKAKSAEEKEKKHSDDASKQSQDIPKAVQSQVVQCVPESPPTSQGTSLVASERSSNTQALAKRRKSVSFAEQLQVECVDVLPQSPESGLNASLNDSDIIASTPVQPSQILRRHSSSRSSLDEPPCTPILKKTKVYVNTEPQPSTSGMQRDSGKKLSLSKNFPKRLAPRRLSTGTETCLRRALLDSQLKNQYASPQSSRGDVSEIEGPSPKNSFGFKVASHNFHDAKVLHEFQYLTALSLELHVKTRGDLRPDPEFDEIRCVFYSIFNDIPPDKGRRKYTGVFMVDKESAEQMELLRSCDPNLSSTSKVTPPAPQALKQTLLQKCGIVGIDVTYVATEEELLKKLVDFVRTTDPDILVGYEIQTLSWGYLLQRASQCGLNLLPQLSRIPGKEMRREPEKADKVEKDEFSKEINSDINIPGRVVLNLWKLLRHEVTLNIYTFENAVFHVLHKRVPKFSHRSLTEWFDHRTSLNRWRTVEYYISRVVGSLDIMDALDMIGQTSEFARVFGIEFYHVFSRGSQYRVESMMLRIAKPMNFIPISPSVQQRARMRAPECIPLTLEPESKLYNHPVVVVDFQSLYPSIMIAYNYCFSTCLGRVEPLAKCNEGPFDFGCTSLNITPAVLKKRKDDVNICPNGCVFLNSQVQKGILPRMVEDILNTRLMVKRSMKENKDDKTLQRLLHARQLGLKLIANVTFGYTAANFSGRMPCVEVGDSIVRKARETLERAIHLVERTPEWGARVVYGDTDSMFILLEGRTKDQAFKIGQEIADAVTADNPKPIKLKFEKVYLPCVLQTKKRYVGFMYETPDQKEPTFDAKGIETVRRDTCSAVSKVLERSIKTLFTTKDISAVKRYFQRQCHKLMEGRVGIQDLVFAKEYRGMAGYKPGACVPALEIARQRLSRDRRHEPLAGERVPYVIVYGPPGLPLIQLVRQPDDLLTDPSLRINHAYYISKQILPPLARIMSLLGVDVSVWYKELPRVVRAVPPSHFTADTKKGTISQYFTTLTCPVCEVTSQGTCAECRADPQRVAMITTSRIRTWGRTFNHLAQVCRHCMGCPDLSSPCVSLDCPVLFRITRASRDLSQAPHLEKIQRKLLNF